MKLLLDQNLSRHLVGALRDIFVVEHVLSLGLDQVSDGALWTFASANGFTIVSKDSDFHHLSFLRGAPPRVIWLNVGNCSTSEVIQLLRNAQERIRTFHSQPDSTFLVLP